MAAMNDSTRRLIMMLTIILAGTAVTFLELSPIIVFIISLLIGIVMLFGLKILSFEELKEDLSSFRERLNQPISLKRSGKVTSEEKKPPKEIKEDKKEKDSGEKKREIPFSGLIEKLPFKRTGTKEAKESPKAESTEKASFLSGLFAGLKTGKKTDKNKEIDDLLDKTINEPVIESKQPEDIPAGAETEIEEDDFSEFDSLDLGLEDEDSDFEFEEEEEPEKESKPGSAPGAAATGGEDEIPDSAIAEILAKEGIDFDLESDDEFPEMDGEGEETGAGSETGEGLNEIDELDGDISGLELDDEELEDFDQMDLDEIEPDEELELEDEEDDIEIGDAEEEAQDVVVAPPDESDDLFAAPPKEWSQTKPGIGTVEMPSEEPMSLSFGGGDDEDLFAMLKADTKKAVTIQELSLIRDLKDTKIESRELVEGLESVLHELGVKVEKIEVDENSNPDRINEE